MSASWAREVHYRSPFVVRRLPLLARYYRFAFHRRASRKVELFFYAPLQRLFALYRGLCRSPRWGELEYDRLGRKQRVRWDARNLQFQALYAPIYQPGYEPEVGVLLDALLPEGGTFYDAGSNWGYFSLYAASRRHRLAVHAFEPFPPTFRDLTGCVEQAGLKDIVVCHNFALSNADGEAGMVLPDSLHSGAAEVSGAGGTPVVRRRLDGLGLPAPDLIKMDVEGHETEVLEGAEGTLSAARPFVVFENKCDYRAPGQTLNPLFFLARLGYVFFQPSLRRQHGGCPYLVPCGFQGLLGGVRAVEETDLLALAELTATDRFLRQHDCNLLACHKDRLDALRAAFGGSV